jgi:hypothetical protein
MTIKHVASLQAPGPVTCISTAPFRPRKRKLSAMSASSPSDLTQIQQHVACRLSTDEAYLEGYERVLPL